MTRRRQALQPATDSVDIFGDVDSSGFAHDTSLLGDGDYGQLESLRPSEAKLWEELKSLADQAGAQESARLAREQAEQLDTLEEGAGAAAEAPAPAEAALEAGGTSSGRTAASRELHPPPQAPPAAPSQPVSPPPDAPLQPSPPPQAPPGQPPSSPIPDVPSAAGPAPQQRQGEQPAVALALTADPPCRRGSCGAHGTCNEVSGECSCGIGYVGPSCEVLAVPSCLSPRGGGHLAVPGVMMPCTCLREWLNVTVRALYSASQPQLV